VLQPGDLVHLEIGGVERRYNCVSMQTLVVPGAEATSAARELYAVALRCLRAGLQQLRPDVPAADVEGPALEIIRRAGLGDVFKMRFGYGVGIGYPPSWLEPLEITRTSTDILRVGTTFVLHTCLLDERERIGVLVGGTYVVTDDGYDMLAGAGAVELA
jgi:Xaa-Pro aminopeptidase